MPAESPLVIADGANGDLGAPGLARSSCRGGMQKYKVQSRWKEARSCTRKKRYGNEYEAEQGMFRAKAKSFYECRFCGGWHITNSLVTKKPVLSLPKP